MNSQDTNASSKARQQIEEDLELISTLSYLLIQAAKSGDDDLKLCAPVLQHTGELIQQCGQRIEEMMERV